MQLVIKKVGKRLGNLSLLSGIFNVVILAILAWRYFILKRYYPNLINGMIMIASACIFVFNAYSIHDAHYSVAMVVGQLCIAILLFQKGAINILHSLKFPKNS